MLLWLLTQSSAGGRPRRPQARRFAAGRRGPGAAAAGAPAAGGAAPLARRLEQPAVRARRTGLLVDARATRDAARRRLRQRRLRQRQHPAGRRHHAPFVANHLLDNRPVVRAHTDARRCAAGGGRWCACSACVCGSNDPSGQSRLRLFKACLCELFSICVGKISLSHTHHTPLKALFRLFRLLASLNYTLQTPCRNTEPSDFS